MNNKLLLIIISIGSGASASMLQGVSPLTTIKLARKDHTTERYNNAQKRRIYEAKHTVYEYGQLLSGAVGTGYYLKSAYSFMKPTFKKDIGISIGATLVGGLFRWKQSSLRASLPALEAAERHAREAEQQAKIDAAVQRAEAQEALEQDRIQQQEEVAQRERDRKAAEAKVQADAERVAEAKRIANEQAMAQRQEQQRKAELMTAALTPEQRADIRVCKDLDHDLQNKTTRTQHYTILACWRLAEKLRANASYAPSEEEQAVIRDFRSLAQQAIQDIDEFNPQADVGRTIVKTLYAMLRHSNHCDIFPIEKRTLCDDTTTRTMYGLQRVRTPVTPGSYQFTESDSVTPGLQQLLADKYLNYARYQEAMRYAAYL